jgi:hypothetical protein
MKRFLILVLIPLALLLLPSPGADADGPLELVFNGEADRLNVYDAETGEKRTLIPSSHEAPEVGLDINAEICFVPDGVPWKPDGEIWFIAGEDTEQNSVPGVIKQGWGVFRLTGDTLDTLAATEIGKFVPDSYVTEESNPENYGCGVLPDGRVVTGDVGDQYPHQPATGQLIVWYPDASHFGGAVPGGDRTTFARIPHCKIDTTIGTSGGIAVDGTDVLIASNRPDLENGEPGGIYRYDSTAWPASEAECPGGVVDPAAQGKELFIQQLPPFLTTPSDIVDSGRDSWFISSVYSGTVAEYDREGNFLRFVLVSTGQAGGITPFGIGVDSDGTLWVADMGVLLVGPLPDQGSVVRIRFDENDVPGQPEVVDEGLQFPDGIGITTVGA